MRFCVSKGLGGESPGYFGYHGYYGYLGQWSNSGKRSRTVTLCINLTYFCNGLRLEI
jgi:hypothetical protein